MSSDYTSRLAARAASAQERLALAEARFSHADKVFEEERRLRLESAASLFRLRGTIVKKIVTKLSGDLLGRCFRAWHGCAQQHAAFKSLRGRGEVVISQPAPGEVSLNGKRSPSPVVASSPNTRFAA